MKKRNDQLLGLIVQQNLNANPKITSITIPDNKPLSSYSILKPQQKIHIYNKDYESKIEMWKRLINYYEQDHPYYDQMLNRKKMDIVRQNIILRSYVLIQGRICECVWQNNRKHGHCKEIFDTGETFEGEYLNGKLQGKTIYIHNNESYKEQWVNGCKHGNGIWKMENDFCEGVWKFGKIDGYGVYIQNNKKYTGSFQEQFKNIDMEQKILSIVIYIMDNFLMENHPLNEGHYCYEGMFENDKKYGQEIFTQPSGNNYVGSFVNNQKHGYGEML
ncbi:unnamed protein product [Paramecium primaurelia]|uniref:MORN repeat protein n=1 Tax=Paramecium primaurelia TaxID=5886 RepID=A0A8S1M041_PARPR|nr:unnamed protein product [Paramecium primaurelia]